MDQINLKSVFIKIAHHITLSNGLWLLCMKKIGKLRFLAFWLIGKRFDMSSIVLYFFFLQIVSFNIKSRVEVSDLPNKRGVSLIEDPSLFWHLQKLLEAFKFYVSSDFDQILEKRGETIREEIFFKRGQ